MRPKKGSIASRELAARRSKISHASVIERYSKGESSVALAKEAGVSCAAIFGILRRNNICSRTTEEANRKKRKYDYDAMIADYKSGLSLNKVGDKHNTTASTVLKIFKSLGFASRGKQGYLRGEAHYLWKGGITRDLDGYAVEKSGRVHRLAMAKFLNRKLSIWEDVHHVDGGKDNFHIDNLVVMPKREHSRFHTYLRGRELPINAEALRQFCRIESEKFWRFTKRDFLIASEKYGYISHPIRKKEKRRCCVKGCGKPNCGNGLCSKHLQRKKARDRGYWISGGGRRTPYCGNRFR